MEPHSPPLKREKFHPEVELQPEDVSRALEIFRSAKRPSNSSLLTNIEETIASIGDKFKSLALVAPPPLATRPPLILPILPTAPPSHFPPDISTNNVALPNYSQMQNVNYQLQSGLYPTNFQQPSSQSIPDAEMFLKANHVAAFSHSNMPFEVQKPYSNPTRTVRPSPNFSLPSNTSSSPQPSVTTPHQTNSFASHLTIPSITITHETHHSYLRPPLSSQSISSNASPRMNMNLNGLVEGEEFDRPFIEHVDPLDPNRRFSLASFSSANAMIDNALGHLSSSHSSQPHGIAFSGNQFTSNSQKQHSDSSTQSSAVRIGYTPSDPNGYWPSTQPSTSHLPTFNAAAVPLSIDLSIAWQHATPPGSYPNPHVTSVPSAFTFPMSTSHSPPVHQLQNVMKFPSSESLSRFSNLNATSSSSLPQSQMTGNNSDFSEW
jgi:hypothetical protein